MDSPAPRNFTLVDEPLAVHETRPNLPKSAATPRPEVDSSPNDQKGTLHQDASEQEAARSRSRGTRLASAAPPGYEIIEELGRGGMGVVYKARQISINRIVALKMILSGENASDEDLSRFQSEASAVARLRHAHIVQLYEFGTYRELPYFTLEYMEGGSLAKRIKSGPMPVSQAADLLRQLAEGMEVAHQHGVIHRDLKPENVLITPEGEAKVADFGLAKQSEQAGHQTRAAVIVGTPSYMSPEQARGDSRTVGPSTDIYALGAILYELLTGRPPFRGATAIDTIQQVRTREPLAPRRIEPGIPRDLETICMKCLQKEIGKRYATSTELKEDLRRFLDGRAIIARPISVPEQGWRWCRRNPAVASLLGGIAALIVVSFILISTQWQKALDRQRAEAQARREAEQARREQEITSHENLRLAEEEKRARLQADQQERIARDEAARAQRSLEFLQNIFKTADHSSFGGIAFRASGELGQNLTAKELLDRGNKQLERDLGDQPLVKATLQRTIGDVYRSMGQYDLAKPLLTQSVSTTKQLLGEDHIEYAQSLFHLAWLTLESGNIDLAESMYTDVLRIQQRLLPEDDPAIVDTRQHLAWTYSIISDPRAEALALGVVAIRSRRLPPGHPDLTVAQITLAAVYLERQEYIKALPLITEVFRHLGGSEGKTDLSAFNLFQQAMVFRSLGFHSKAEKSFAECLTAAKKLAGKYHLYYTLIQHELATTLVAQNKLDEAESMFEECIQNIRMTCGLSHPRAVVAVHSASELMVKRKKHLDAIKLFEETLTENEKRLGSRNRFRFRLLCETGRLLLLHGVDHPRGLRMADEALSLLPTAHGSVNDKGHLTNMMGVALYRGGYYDKAHAFHKASLTIFNSVKASNRGDVAQVEWNQGLALGRLRRFADAVLFLEQSFERGRGTDTFNTEADEIDLMVDLGAYQFRLGNAAAAEKAFRRSMDLARNLKDYATGQLARRKEELAIALVELDRAADAVPLLDEASRFDDKGQTRHFEDGLRYLLLVHTLLGNTDERAKTLAIYDSTFGRTNSISLKARYLRTLALTNQLPADKLPELLKAAAALQSKNAEIDRDCKIAHAMLLLRAGKPGDAELVLGKLPEPVRTWSPTVGILLAWCARDLGQIDSAPKLFAGACRLLDEPVDWQPAAGPALPEWSHRLECRVLRRELSALLK